MKSRKLLIFYLLLLSVVLLAMCFLYIYSQHRHDVRDYNEICKDGTIRIVTEYSKSGYFMSNDTIEGFQYELCRAISNISGLNIYIILDMSLTESFKGLDEKKYDVIAKNIPATSEIKDKYLFTDPILFNKQVLVQLSHADNDSIEPIRNQLDLAQKTLYVPKNSPAIMRIANLQHEIGDTIFVIEEPRYSSEQLIIMVAKGEIDYAVCDKLIAQAAKEQFPEIDIDTDISFTQFQSWAVRKDSPALLDSLNMWLKTIHNNGTYNQIYKKYYR